MEDKVTISTVSVIDQASSSSYQILGYQPVGNERQLGNMINYHYTKLHYYLKMFTDSGVGLLAFRDS